MNSSYSTVHTPIDYLSYLGSDIAVSLMVLEIRALPVGTLGVITLYTYIPSLYNRIFIYVNPFLDQRLAIINFKIEFSFLKKSSDIIKLLS